MNPSRNKRIMEPMNNNGKQLDVWRQTNNYVWRQTYMNNDGKNWKKMMRRKITKKEKNWREKNNKKSNGAENTIFLDTRALLCTLLSKIVNVEPHYKNKFLL